MSHSNTFNNSHSIASETLPLCSGHGQTHSPTGRRRPRPLETITLPDVRAMLAQPQQVAKKEAQWFIPSTLLSRQYKEQLERGEFVALWADLDEVDGRDFEDISQSGVVVDAEVWCYTSHSATASNPKSRLIIPLSRAVSGREWQQLQKALNRRLAAAGLVPDRVSERPGQLCFLPNAGEFYQSAVIGGGPLDPDALADDLALLEGEALAEQAIASAAHAAAAAAAAEATGQLSPVEAFNAANSVASLLDRYGYRRYGNRWLSPNSKSGVPGVTLKDDGTGWLSAHASDAAIGKPNDTGRDGDAFDLYVHYEHNDDYSAAVRAAGEQFRTPDGRTITEANRDRWVSARAAEAVKAGFGADPFGWAGKYEIADCEVEALADPDWVIPNFLIAGHIAVISARSGSGKTTIVQHLCPDIVKAGYQVLYVNVDAPPGEIKRAHALAKKHGYRLLAPDYKVGLSASHVLADLARLNASGADLRNTVLIFDTLKRFTDLMSKNKSKEFLQLLSALRGKGATSILLAHVNKHAGIDGKDVFEGVGDLRNDCDELLYLDALKHEDGSLTVTTRPDKVRGQFSPITFQIAQDRTVALAADTVDVAGILHKREQKERDQYVIDAIVQALRDKCCTQTEITGHITDRRSIGINTIHKVLKRYSSGPERQWYSQRGMSGHVVNYSLEPFAPIK